MANVIAKQNVITTWICGGTSDYIICSDTSQSMRGGVQIETNGFNLENATVTVIQEGGAEKVIVLPVGTGEIATVGYLFSVDSVKISGVAAGTYNVTFRQ